MQKNSKIQKLLRKRNNLKGNAWMKKNKEDSKEQNLLTVIKLA